MKKLLSFVFMALFCIPFNVFSKNLIILPTEKPVTGTHPKATDITLKKNKTGTCDVYYSSDTPTGSISQIVFSDGTNPPLTYSGATLSGGITIPQGIYTVTITTSGGQYNPSTHTGFDSFYYYGDVNAPSACYAYNSSYVITLDLSIASYISLYIDYGQCS